MKVDSLLAQYLYQQKKLQLPGIGLFTFTETAPEKEDDSKPKPLSGTIAFEYRPQVSHDDAFIEFIRQQTGKMKPLAEADLDAYIMGALQFLNIGKPFYIEAIGTVLKGPDGIFRFTPGEITTVKLDDIAEKHSEIRRKSVFAGEAAATRNASGTRNYLLLVLGIIGTLALVVGGGYLLYHKNTGGSSDGDKGKAVVLNDTTATEKMARDTIKTAPASDTNRLVQPKMDANPAPAPGHSVASADSFKFILETTGRHTAQLRYSLLKPKVQVQQKDSLRYQVYITLRRPAADTARLRDSLKNWYWGPRKDKKVTIEQ